MSYKLVWKTQGNNAAQDEMHNTLESAIAEFRVALKGLYAHGGGMVAIIECEQWEHGIALVKWEEHLSGGYGSGTAWADVNPLGNLDRECEEPDCCWNNDDSEEMCEDCERAGLEMVLDYLVR